MCYASYSVTIKRIIYAINENLIFKLDTFYRYIVVLSTSSNVRIITIYKIPIDFFPEMIPINNTQKCTSRKCLQVL